MYIFINAALQTRTVVGVSLVTLPGSGHKVGQIVFNVPHALLTKLHKGFKMLVHTVVTTKIDTNIHNYPQEPLRRNITSVTARSVETWETQWTFVASAVSAQRLSTRRTGKMPPNNKNITKLDPCHYGEKMMRLWKFV